MESVSVIGFARLAIMSGLDGGIAVCTVSLVCDDDQLFGAGVSDVGPVVSGPTVAKAVSAICLAMIASLCERS